LAQQPLWAPLRHAGQIQVVIREQFLILVVVMPIPASRGAEIKSQQLKMVKSLAALAIFCLLGVSVIAAPGFAPKVEAGEVAVLAKGDRLGVGALVLDCSSQIWPDFTQSCLRGPDSGMKILEARLVTSRR